MIGSPKNNREIIRENAFEHKKKKPGLNPNRPSNNWAQEKDIRFIWRRKFYVLGIVDVKGRQELTRKFHINRRGGSLQNMN